MKYMGGKSRTAKYIVPIIESMMRPGQCYVEPFVGGANIVSKIAGPRKASDSNEYLICMYKALQSGWTPPDNVGESMYMEFKHAKPMSPMTAFIGFGCSFGGKWFAGYARPSGKRNYCGESSRGLINKSKLIQGVEFTCSTYEMIDIPAESFIYCDPPYLGTQKYLDKIDYNDFWDWCRAMSWRGHDVLVSEQNAPADFSCVWEMNVSRTLNVAKAKTATEKLFIYNGLKEI